MPPRAGSSSGSASASAGPPTNIAFVLPGGATRGASQVGMLRALTEAGIHPDYLVGTSVGALNAVSYAQDPTTSGLDHLAELWVQAPRSQIFPLSPAVLAGNVRRHAGYLFENQGLRAWIEAHSRVERLEDLPIPVHAVATDLATNTAVVLSDGDTLSALLASSAIPGIFPPVERSGATLGDGAATADTPLAQAVALGATTIYVLPTFPTGPVPLSPGWQFLDRVFGRPAGPEVFGDYPGVAVHWLPAPHPDGNPFSFRASRRLVREAHELARSFLAQSVAPARPTFVPDSAWRTRNAAAAPRPTHQE